MEGQQTMTHREVLQAREKYIRDGVKVGGYKVLQSTEGYNGGAFVS